MVAIRGQAAVWPGRTADPASRARRQVVARSTASLLAAAALLGLQACGSVGPRDDAGSGRMLPDPTNGGAGTEIVMQALAQVGKPYRWGGSDPREGFDCSGLVAHVYEDALGIRLPRTSRDMSRRGGRIGAGRLAAGDLVFFNTARRAYSHVGIYVGSGRFVHAPATGSLVRVERMDSRYWASRFDGARRIVAGAEVASVAAAGTPGR